jgi:hypothetical protein
VDLPPNDRVVKGASKFMKPLDIDGKAPSGPANTRCSDCRFDPLLARLF